MRSCGTSTATVFDNASCQVASATGSTFPSSSWRMGTSGSLPLEGRGSSPEVSISCRAMVRVTGMTYAHRVGYTTRCGGDTYFASDDLLPDQLNLPAASCP